MGVVLLLLMSVPAMAGTLEENRALIRKTLALMEKDPDTMGGFYYVRRREVKEFDGDGRLKKRDSETMRRVNYEGVVVERLVSRDDAALSPEEEQAQKEWMIRQAEAYRRDGPPEEESRHRKEDRELLRQLPEALDYELVGTEKLAGREALVFRFKPRPGYRAPSMKFRMFEKTRGKAWIDKATLQLLLVDAEVYDNVNVGFGIIGTIGKGTRFRLERREVVPSEWVTVAQRIKFDARVMLLKSLHREIEVRYNEFAPVERAMAEAEQ